MRAVLFDFGHTLFDLRTPEQLVQAEFSKMGGRDAPQGRIASAWANIQRTARSPAELAMARDSSAQAHRDNWVRLFRPLDAICDGLAEAIYAAHLKPENWVPYADAKRVLEQLQRADVQVAIVSDTGFDLRPILDQQIGRGFIQSFVLSFEHGRVKPDPELFRLACASLGVRTEDTLMVGDNAATDGGAIAIGCTALLLPPAPASGAVRGLEKVAALVGITG